LIDHDEESGSGYWPSVSDLFITLFIVTMAILAVTIFVSLPSVGDIITQGDGIKKTAILEPTNLLGEVLLKERIGLERKPSFVIAELNANSIQVVEEIKLLRGPGGVNDLIAELRKQIANLEEENWKLEEENVRLKPPPGGDAAALAVEVFRLKSEVSRLEQVIKTLNDKPPIIVIPESMEYRFNIGMALISETFATGLNSHAFKTLADEIVKRNSGGQSNIDTLEIIGHTDGVPFSDAGNLDQRLPGLLVGDWESMSVLRAGSNNDLGLLRALAVKKAWTDFVDDERDKDKKSHLEAIEVRCYSAGQTIPPSRGASEVSQAFSRDDFSKDDPAARRIEMRLTRLRESPSAQQ